MSGNNFTRPKKLSIFRHSMSNLRAFLSLNHTQEIIHPFSTSVYLFNKIINLQRLTIEEDCYFYFPLNIEQKMPNL